MNDVTCALVGAIWPGQHDLLAGGQVLDRRMVRWGARANTSTVPQVSVVIDGELLLARLAARLVDECPGQVHLADRTDSPDKQLLRDALGERIWVIDASGRTSRAATLLGAA
ncbi:MAG: hypothetical protein M3O34_15620, partial [Chloroflexota bacterium]|nr:hypothetical protein [Chloroflexota bacterium]